MSDQWKTFWQRLAVWALGSVVAVMAVGNGWALAEIVELKGRQSVTESRIVETRQWLERIDCKLDRLLEKGGK
jgi:hypothetical protein